MLRYSRTCVGGRPPLKKRGLGTYPFIVTPLKNFDGVIPYFNFTFDGVRRRAWLLPPEYDGEVAKVKLETMDMSLGCDGRPQRVDLQTNVVEVGANLPPTVPVLMLAYNSYIGMSLRLGCSESAEGKLTFSPIGTPDVCLASPATYTWPILSGTNPLQQALYSGVTVLCQTSNGRVLRALPTLSRDTFELAWRAPASGDGFDVDLTIVLDTVCLSCDRIVDPTFPPDPPCCKNAGTFGLGGCCG